LPHYCCGCYLGHALGDGGLLYTRAGLTVLRRLLDEPYLSTDPHHEGILLQSIGNRRLTGNWKETGEMVL
jgi:hypothetical protein